MKPAVLCSRLGLLLISVLCASAFAHAEDVARRPFSEEEKKKLVAGDLVTRPTEERRGDLRLLGGAAWQVINAPPDAVFRALLDTAHYHKLLPTVSRATLVTEAPTQRRVTLEHKKGPLGIAYRIALTIDAPKRDITFKLNDRLESGMRAAWGFLAVTPYGNKSLLSYGIMADPGEGLIVGLVRSTIHGWMMRVPRQIRWHVESSEGRARYGYSSGLVRSCTGVRQLDGGQAQQCAP